MRQLVGPLGIGFVSMCAIVFGSGSGCGAGKVEGVRVEGKLINANKPIVVGTGQTLNIVLSGKGSKGEDVSYPATVNPGGTSFVFPGPSGAGIPPGKYKLGVNLTAPMGNTPPDLEKSATLNKPFETVNGKEVDVGPEPVQIITIDAAAGVISKGGK